MPLKMWFATVPIRHARCRKGMILITKLNHFCSLFDWSTRSFIVSLVLSWSVSVRSMTRLRYSSPMWLMVSEPVWWKDSAHLAEARFIIMSHVYEFLVLGYTGYLTMFSFAIWGHVIPLRIFWVDNHYYQTGLWTPILLRSWEPTKILLF